MLCRSFDILYCMPCTSETTAMTAATPIITPNTVRTERSLLALMAVRAIFRFSVNMKSLLHDVAAEHHERDMLERRHIIERIAGYGNEVSEFAGGNLGAIVDAEKLGRAESRGADGVG